MHLSSDEIKRYSRHLILPEIGQEGQLKIKASKVLLVGAGGLGSPVALYLSALGVGTIGIVDADLVDFSNLHRQVIHFTSDLGKPKVQSAQEKMNQINPEIKVISYQARLNSHNAMDIIKNYDFVIDGTDNFPSRYLINDACVLLNKPFIFAGIFRFEGQVSVFNLDNGPCYRCFFEEPPKSGEVPSCADAGVLGILPGIVGLLQANEALKLMCNIGEPLNGRLLIFEALLTHFRELKVKKNPKCAICSPHRSIHQLQDVAQACTTQQEGEEMESVPEISVMELKEILDNKSPNEFSLIDVREEMEWDIANIEGAKLKPLSTFEEDYKDIPQDKPVYIHCKVGGRSRRAAEFLRAKGYKKVYNVAGGIDAWRQEIDPSLDGY